MTDWVRWFSGGDGGGKRIFEGVGEAGADFKVVAENIRPGSKGSNFVLDDRGKWKRVVERWRFEPKHEPLSRCGYDYRIQVTNGPAKVTVVVCFVCRTLIVNNSDRYAASKRQILALFEADFRVSAASR